MTSTMSAFMAGFKALIVVFSAMLRNGWYGGSFLSSELGPGMAGFVVGWCAVVNENHMFIWVESCLGQKITKSLSSHSSEKCRVKNESIGE